jgi:hypothetical protein
MYYRFLTGTSRCTTPGCPYRDAHIDAVKPSLLRESTLGSLEHLVWWVGENVGGCVVGQTKWVAVGAGEVKGGSGRVCKALGYRCVELVEGCILAPGSISNISLLFVSAMGLDDGGDGLPYIGKLLCTVLGAGAGVERRRAKPVGEVSCAGGLGSFCLRSLQRCVAGDHNRPAERGVVAAS